MIAGERLAMKARAIERHLARVEAVLPAAPSLLRPMTAESDAVVLHFWQAVQIGIDLAVSACAERKLGTPADYASAFRTLSAAGVIGSPLAERLVLAVGFRNAVAHAYESLDLPAVWAAGHDGPADLRAFLHALAAAPVAGPPK